jgi:hypothetical protein
LNDALKRLDNLTQEEARMAAAQNLKATQTVDDSLRPLRDVYAKVVSIGGKVEEVNDVSYGGQMVFSCWQSVRS